MCSIRVASAADGVKRRAGSRRETRTAPSGKPATSRQYGALTASQKMAMTDAGNRKSAMLRPVTTLKRKSAPAPTHALNQSQPRRAPRPRWRLTDIRYSAAASTTRLEHDHRPGITPGARDRPARRFPCAGEDLNLHGALTPQGPQPCASTNSATSARDGQCSQAVRVRQVKALAEAAVDAAVEREPPTPTRGRSRSGASTRSRRTAKSTT